METELDVARQQLAQARVHLEDWRVRYEALENVRQAQQAAYIQASLRVGELAGALREAADILEAEGLTGSAARAREVLQGGRGEQTQRQPSG